MKDSSFIRILGLAGMFAVLTNASAQGTLHISNLQYPTISSLPVGNDAWIALWFQTGPSAGGYVLDSIQLSMDSATGSPSGLGVMLWDFAQDRSIVDLAGPDPVLGGVFSYEANGFAMAPSTVYWFAVTSETPVAEGAFNWNYKSSGYVYTNGWTLGGTYNFSSDGLEWNRTEAVGSFQFAINATAVPEPTPLALLGLAGLCLVSGVLKRRAVSVSGRTP